MTKCKSKQGKASTNRDGKVIGVGLRLDRQTDRQIDRQIELEREEKQRDRKTAGRKTDRQVRIRVRGHG